MMQNARYWKSSSKYRAFSAFPLRGRGTALAVDEVHRTTDTENILQWLPIYVIWSLVSGLFYLFSGPWFLATSFIAAGRKLIISDAITEYLLPKCSAARRPARA